MRPDDIMTDPDDEFTEPPRPITKEEEAVIEAAVNVVKRYELTGQCTSKTAEGERLVNAVRALTAPKGVRPEEVEPGTRFRFVTTQSRPAYEYDGPYTFVKAYTGGYAFSQYGWMKDGCIYGFYDDDRIIPIEQD